MFLDNLEYMFLVSLFDSLLTILIGDFNTKCASWYSKGDSTTEDSKLDQMINEPTHVKNDFSTCTDLLLTSQTNLVIECIWNNMECIFCYT